MQANQMTNKINNRIDWVSKRLKNNSIAESYKHLRGRHDQRTHAWNRGMGGGGSGGGVTATAPTAASQSPLILANNPVAAQRLQLMRAPGSTGRAGTLTIPSAATSTVDALAARLESISVQQEANQRLGDLERFRAQRPQNTRLLRKLPFIRRAADSARKSKEAHKYISDTLDKMNESLTITENVQIGYLEGAIATSEKLIADMLNSRMLRFDFFKKDLAKTQEKLKKDKEALYKIQEKQAARILEKFKPATSSTIPTPVMENLTPEVEARVRSALTKLQGMMASGMLRTENGKPINFKVVGEHLGPDAALALHAQGGTRENPESKIVINLDTIDISSIEANIYHEFSHALQLQWAPDIVEQHLSYLRQRLSGEILYYDSDNKQAIYQDLFTRGYEGVVHDGQISSPEVLASIDEEFGPNSPFPLEVLSTGIEQFMTDPAGLILRDPDLFIHIASMMEGKAKLFEPSYDSNMGLYNVRADGEPERTPEEKKPEGESEPEKKPDKKPKPEKKPKADDEKIMPDEPPGTDEELATESELLQGRTFSERTAGVAGKEAIAYAPNPKNIFRVRHRIIDLADIKASNLLSGSVNPDYDATLQPRDRDRDAYRAQIGTIAKELIPSILIRDSMRTDVGSPIINADGMVLSGNGRVMALQLLQDDSLYPGRADAYRDEVLARARSLGIDPSEIAGMKFPVVVRELADDVDYVSFARDANAPSSARMSPIEDARVDALRVTPELISLIDPGDGDNIDEALSSPSGRPFIRAFLAILPANERAAYLTADGYLNANGLIRAKAAVFAATFNSAVGDELTTALLDGQGDMKSIQTGLAGSLPALAKVSAEARKGTINPDMDPANDISTAIVALGRILRMPGLKDFPRKEKVRGWLNQGDFTIPEGKEKLTPAARTILEHIDTIASSPRKLRQFFNELAANILEQKEGTGQENIFGDLGIAPMDLDDIVKATIAAQNKPTITSASSKNDDNLSDMITSSLIYLVSRTKSRNTSQRRLLRMAQIGHKI